MEDSDDDNNKNDDCGPNEIKVVCPLDTTRLIYKSVWIDKNDINEDARCDICLGDDDNEGDEMVFCDGCNVVAHQTCYGRDICHNLPNEHDLWFC